MVRIKMTGISKKPSGIIGNPIYIGENADSGEFFRNSSVNTNDSSTAQHLLACDSVVIKEFNGFLMKLFLEVDFYFCS